MKHKIKIFNLNNRDLIIGQIYKKSVDTYYVLHPLKINSEYDELTKGHALYLTNYLPFSTNRILSLRNVDIQNVSNPLGQVREHYLEILYNAIKSSQKSKSENYYDILEQWNPIKDKIKKH